MHSSAMRSLLFPLVALCALSGCTHVGPYVWVDEYKEELTSSSGYLIVPGDVLNVRVFNQEAMSGRVRVRNDGKVSLPFVNDVDAAGRTPLALAQFLQGQLKSYINNPVVTVSLEEVKPIPVSVLGEVARPGVYPLEPGSGVLHAVASAGGLNDFASRDRVFVIRNAEGKATATRIRFDYERLSKAEGKSAAFHLRTGDVVVVE